MCSGLKPVARAMSGMKAIAPDTIPQENMIRAIQIRAPTLSMMMFEGTSNRK